ncbi:hypothetical protein KPL70_004126 [Citrus sinensis]|nr:hypothetical protein KPL70_004126 [Citrus sinensis]
MMMAQFLFSPSNSDAPTGHHGAAAQILKLVSLLVPVHFAFDNDQMALDFLGAAAAEVKILLQAFIYSRLDELRSQIQGSSTNTGRAPNQPHPISSSTEVNSSGVEISPVLCSMKMENLKHRFGASLCEDPQGNLSKLSQTTTVAEFQTAFEDLMNQVTGISEPLLISFFITGLKPDIHRELLFAWPSSLMEAFALARAYEAPGMVHVPSHSQNTPPPPKLNTLPPLLPTPNLPIRRLTPAELHDKHEKGLCYNCDQKYSANHRCRSKFLLLMGTDDNEPASFEQELPPESVEEVITGDISSLNALAGQINPRSLRLIGEVGYHSFQVLIDSGSTHNFVKPTVAERMGLPIQPTSPFRVYIGNGNFLVCKYFCPQVALTLQGTVFTLDLFVLPIEGPDVVLGIQWLQLLGRISHDYSALSMEFCWNGAPVPAFREESTSNPESSSFELPANLTQPFIDLLHSYRNLFLPLTTLPPHRTIDHKIHLLPKTTPINVRPYRYPHFQKNEMEKLIREMALNAVTIKDKFPIPTIDELFDELGRAAVFSKLDLWAGYHQIRVHHRDIYKTAFRTHEGHYDATAEEHLWHLQQVLVCLHFHQFFVKLSKCLFCQENIDYLGHIVLASGVRADPQKIEAMTQTAAEAFDALKKAMVEAPVLRLPDFYADFILETDASNGGIGAVLMQSGHPISYFSKKLGPRLRASSTYIKELITIVEAVHKWRQYLLDRFFVIRTDHKSIKELLQQVVQTPDQQIYIRKLLGYHFRIEYKPGCTNLAVDALSRVQEKAGADTSTVTASCLPLLSRPSFELLATLNLENSTLSDMIALHHQFAAGTLSRDYSLHNGYQVHLD